MGNLVTKPHSFFLIPHTSTRLICVHSVPDHMVTPPCSDVIYSST